LQYLAGGGEKPDSAMMKPLDVLRGFYARSPEFVRTAAKPLVALVPTRMKFGGTYAKWRDQISRAANDPQFAYEQHVASLRALLAKAHRGSPFYRELIENAFGADFDASTVMPADLRRLPVLDKSLMRQAGDAMLAAPRWQMDSAGTNGSNSEPPFTFFLDKDRSPREMAFVYDAWSRIGFRERDARVRLRGFQLKDSGSGYYDWDPALRELKLAVFPMLPEDVPTYLDQIDRRKIRFLYGYPSAIELLCRHMQKIGRTPRAGIKGILPISEPLFDHQRRLIRDVLGNVAFSAFYGLSEKAAFAIELAGDEGVYEFNPLYGLTELLDENNDPVIQPGREGRIVGTGFLSTGMPFIRYDTGDFGRLVELPTRENGERLRVKSLTPRRKPEFLISFNGQRIVTTMMTLMVSSEGSNSSLLKGISEFQFFQETPGHVVIRYILDKDGSKADIDRFLAHMTARCQGQLAFDLEPVAQIAAGRNGKRAFIDQRLDVMRY
jgi:phenylacetate-CoA ligase